MTDLTDTELALALSGECHTVEVVVWLAREVKRCRDAQRAAVNIEAESAGGAGSVLKSQGMPEIFPFVTLLHREVVLRHKDGGSQDIEMTPIEAGCVATVLREAAEICSLQHCIQLSGNAPLEIVFWVAPQHCKVVLRHKDGESQDIELTLDEAKRVADQLCEAADAVAAKVLSPYLPT